MSRENVLRGRGSFVGVRSHGRLARVGIVRVDAAVNPVGTARIGLAVPRVRGAVSRNRIRRRLRAAGVALSEHQGFDLVVSAGGEALRLPFGDLQAQVSAAARLAVARARGGADDARRLDPEPVRTSVSDRAAP